MTSQQLFEAHRDLAARAANRVPYQERPAAENAALLALWQAAQTFDPVLSRDGFRGFAAKKCKWAVIDHIRREGPLTHRGFPRYGPPAMSLEEASTGRYGDDLGIIDSRAADPAETDETDDLLHVVCQKGRMRWMGDVARRLADGLSQTDIARELGLSPSRVSQIVRVIRRRLSRVLTTVA